MSYVLHNLVIIWCTRATDFIWISFCRILIYWQDCCTMPLSVHVRVIQYFLPFFVHTASSLYIFLLFFFYFLLWIRVQEDTMAWKVIFVLILYFMEFIEVILFSSKSFLWQCTHHLLQLDHDISFSLCLFGTALISPILFSTTQKNSQKNPNLRSYRTNSQAQHKHLQPQ